MKRDGAADLKTYLLLIATAILASTLAYLIVVPVMRMKPPVGIVILVTLGCVFFFVGDRYFTRSEKTHKGN